MKNKFQGPPQTDFGRTKAEMGCLSQKGLCYSFEILQGLLSIKILRFHEKNIWGIPPISPMNPILTGKWENLVKSTLQTRVPENFR